MQGRLAQQTARGSADALRRGRDGLPFLCLGLALLACLCGSKMEASEVLIVVSSDAEPYQETCKTLERQLKDSGFKVNSVMLEDLSDGDLKTLSATERPLAVAIGTEAAEGLHRRVPDELPLEYCMVADPESAGLNKGHPAQGVVVDVPLRAQFDLINEALPNTRTVGILYNRNSEKDQRMLKDVRAAVPGAWRLEAVAMEDFDGFAKASNALFEKKPDLVWTSPDSAKYNSNTVRALLLEGMRRKVPIFGFSLPFVKAGALLGVGISPQVQGEQAAEMARQLMGTGTGTPTLDHSKFVVWVPRFQVSINLIVAEKLSLKMNDDVIRKAAEVIGPH